MDELNQPRPNTLENQMAYLLLVTCAVAFLCWFFFDSFVYWTSWVLYWLWMMIDVPYTHVWAAGKINLLAATANNAQAVTLEEWLDVMNATSGILMVFMAPLVVLSSWSLAYHPKASFRSRRVINIHTLPKMLSKFAPAVIPVLANSGRDGLMNDTSELNAWPLWPEEFASKHNLVTRKVLDVAAAEAVFTDQVGRPLNDLEDLLPHERALFAVFGAQVFLDDRPAAKALLDNLNYSTAIKGMFGQRRESYDPIYSLADSLWARVKTASGVAELVNTHGFVRSALFGLYARDLRLPPAQFRWLKCVDRTLWYGLQTANTTSVFVEGSGIAAQARAELKAQRDGLPPPGLLVEKAIEGLQLDLETIGLVFAIEPRLARRRQRKKSTALAASYTAADASETDD